MMSSQQFGFGSQVPQIFVKAYLGNQTKRFRTAWPCSLADMIKNMNKAFKGELKGTVQYCDEDNDWISVEKEEEWAEVQALFSPAKTLKLRIDNGQGASKQLEQAIEKTLYQIDAFALALQKEGAQAATSQPVRSVYETIRNKLEELVPAELWADIFGERRTKTTKDQEFTVEVDLKSSSVNLIDAQKKPVTPVVPVVQQPSQVPQPQLPPQVVPQQPMIAPQPVVWPQQQPLFPQQPMYSPFTFTQQPVQQTPAQGTFGTKHPSIVQQQPPVNKTPEQSWTFMEVANTSKPVQNAPFSFNPQPATLPQPPTTTLPVQQPPVVQQPSTPGKYATELKQLQDMGLPPANLPVLLEKHNGNIAAVIQEVFSTQ